MPRYDGMVFNRGAFLAALGSDWSVDIKRVRSVGTCCCGGQGAWLQSSYSESVLADRFEGWFSWPIFERTFRISSLFPRRLPVVCLGLFMNTLHGSGMVFLQAGGTVMRCRSASRHAFLFRHRPNTSWNHIGFSSSLSLAKFWDLLMCIAPSVYC